MSSPSPDNVTTLALLNVAPSMTLAQLNEAGRAAFIDAVGSVFEHSPWIAAAAWERRPFRTLAGLHARMVAIVEEAPLKKRLTLIAAHPELAGRTARLTSASREEQASAGLERLTRDELARLEQLNRIYRRRFGFPFVICVRRHDKTSIFAALERRLRNDREAEIAVALNEIAKIARLRLQQVLGAS